MSIKERLSNAARNGATTLLGSVESAVMSVGADMLFDLTWQQRAWVYGVAIFRALFAVVAADAKKALQPAVDPDKTPPGGTRLQ
jgi:hypothetical protein